MRRLALTPSAGAAVAAMARLPRSSRARKENAMRRLRVIVVESRDGLVREQLPGRRGTRRKGGAMRRLSFIGVCLTPVLLLLGAAGSPAAASTSVPVTIQDTVIIGPFTGTWSASGGISDSGTLTQPVDFRVGVGAGGFGQVHLSLMNEIISPCTGRYHSMAVASPAVNSGRSSRRRGRQRFGVCSIRHGKPTKTARTSYKAD